MWFGVVDVRDVADLHLQAMIDPSAAGERFIAVSGEPVSLLMVASILRERFPEFAARVPNRGASSSRSANHRRSSSNKARQRLDWKPRTSVEAIVASAESLIRLRLLETLN
jgi:dihydroflavonol-4-reductase